MSPLLTGEYLSFDSVISRALCRDEVGDRKYSGKTFLTFCKWAGQASGSVKTSPQSGREKERKIGMWMRKPVPPNVKFPTLEEARTAWWSNGSECKQENAAQLPGSSGFPARARGPS
jgi:hypothetical protein